MSLLTDCALLMLAVSLLCYANQTSLKCGCGLDRETGREVAIIVIDLENVSPSSA